MSRTYRKRFESFEQHYKELLDDDSFREHQMKKYGNKWKERMKAHYYGKTEKWHYYNLPKHFRKFVNRSRRRADAQKEHIIKQQEPDSVLFDTWNCKTSNSWGYW
jgi:hypothetical protein